VYSSSDFETTSLHYYINNASSTIGAYTGIQFAVGNNGDAAISAIRTGDGESALTFGTRGSGVRGERMRINSSGHVTKPYHPAFAARGLSNASTSNYVTGLATPLVFSTVGVNTGSFYNNANGRFTAPVAGVYYFSWNLLIDDSQTTGTVNYAQIYVNGASAGYLCYSQTMVGGYYTPMSQSCVLSLSANDYVNIQGLGGFIHVGSESAFTGHLIG
jgi:hypothetical protein